MFASKSLAAAAVSAAVLAVPLAARANERHFTFTYESATLPAGQAEIEPRITTRFGRQEYFLGLDYRLEFEGGITDRFQASLYFNGSSFAAGDGDHRQSGSSFDGISTEFKYRLLDSVADPIGLALYAEITLTPQSLELEGKAILDRRFGNVLFALNLVYAHEWAFGGAMPEEENEFEADLGLGYFVAPNLSIGIEARNHNNQSTLYGYEYSVLYAGPAISYATGRFWAALSVLPQLGALHGASPGDFRNLEDHEMVDARIILGLHL